MGVLLPIRRQGRVPTHDGALSLRLFPRCSYLEQRRYVWLYAVGFSDGRVKLGMTHMPRERLNAYWNISGGAIAWVHLFQRMPIESNSRRASRHPAERLALEYASRLAARVGKTEYFTGLQKADALRCVRRAIAEVTA